MAEQKQCGVASKLPLPGAVMRPEQAAATLSLWEQLCKVQEHPAFRSLLVDLQLGRNEMRERMRGERDPAKMREYRIRALMAGLPNDVLLTWGGLAKSAMRVKQAADQADAERKAAGDTETQAPPAPQGFDSEQEAAEARATGMALDELVSTPGWAYFSMLLAAHAWALDFFIAHCHEGDVAFYQEARRQVVGVLTNVQAAIDRGVDATAWLSAKAEREKETE